MLSNTWWNEIKHLLELTDRQNLPFKYVHLPEMSVFYGRGKDKVDADAVSPGEGEEKLSKSIGDV